MALKKAFSVALFLFIVLGGSSSSLFAAVDASGKYTNKEKGFSVTFPKSWETKEGVAGSVVASLSPRESDSDNFRENVNIVIEDLPKEMTSEEYYQAGIQNLKTVPGFKEEQKGKMMIDGKEVVTLVASHKSNNVSAKMVQYYVVKGKRAYIITGTALSDTFSKYKSQFDEIAKTFKTE